MSKIILYGLLLGLIDVIMISLLKLKFDGKIAGQWIFILAMLVYSVQPLIFYKSLSYGTMIQMNYIWDLTSDILVLIVGLYIFKEDLTNKQRLGILLGLISLYLLK